jgi:uncharacterized protein (TIGR00369 family)
MPEDPVRTRTYSWNDPRASVDRTRPGKESLAAQRDGDLPTPPFAVTLGMKLVDVAEGRAVFTMVPAEFQFNPLGVVHGGVIATLMDSAMACAIQTLLPPGLGATTLELKTNFVRPITIAAGEIRAEGRVLHLGKQIALAEARATDANGKLFAHATSTCMVIGG